MQTEKRADQRIRIIGPIINIAFTVAVLVWFNLLPNTVGYYITASDPASFTPVLTPTFLTYVIWLDIWWGATILLNVAHLIYGRWTTTTRLADMILSMYGIFVLLWMVSGPPFLAGLWLSVVFKVILSLAAFGLAVSILAQVVRIFKIALTSGTKE